MFRPRHTYKSPITYRYRGKAKGCPVFNNLNDINSTMVEQHDECLECLAKIKNRTDLYRTLAENNKPSNNVIKSLQRLSSSASNNRLKTCLQFLIIRVNEKSITTPQQKQQKPNERNKQNQLASPPQNLVSSTQDQVGPTHDEQDCQTSPMTLISTNVDDPQQTKDEQLHFEEVSTAVDSKIRVDGSHLNQNTQISESNNFATQTQPSPPTSFASTTTANATTSTSPIRADVVDGTAVSSISNKRVDCDEGNARNISTKKRKTATLNSDPDTSSITSWSSTYSSPSSPTSSSSSSSSSVSTSSSPESSSSSCSSTLSSPFPSPDISNELRGPRLKLSEEKIRKIKKRPVLFDDTHPEQSFASTPTTSSGCSPGNSSTTQNSDQSRTVIHMFQAPPRFVNNLKPCILPIKEETPSNTPATTTKEMLNCAICGIKDRPPNISKIYGQNSCSICASFFLAFLNRPQQLYCAHDGDCLMTFDSRCQACWIKICLQKFDIDEENRKVGQKFSPKLLSFPNVSLITIDTSLSR